MPHLNGIEVAARSQKLDRPPRVVILSMHADESYIIRALAAGARAYLLKDATDEDLLPALRAVAAGRNYFSAAVTTLLVPPQKIDWVKVGALIGMKSEISEYLGIGVIRRITRDAHQQRRVGIQVLTKTAIPITISKSSTMSALNFDLREETAILLTVKPDARGEVEVLLREGIFNGRDSLEMTLQRRNFRLEPLRTLEAGDDFYWAKFKVTQQAE